MCRAAGSGTSGVHVVGAKWRREVPPSRRLTTREQVLPWAVSSVLARWCRVNRAAFAVGTLAVAGACSKAANAGSCHRGPKLVIAARPVKTPHDRWRSWHAGQRYRATIHGKERRREQARRHRERARQRSALAEPAPRHLPIEPALPVIEAQTNPSPIEPIRHRRLPERRASAQQKSPKNLAACLAIGQGATSSSSPRCASQDQQFCSAACRQALRRVRQREARLRHRRRRGTRPLRRPRGGPPQATSFMSSRLENDIP